jgi:hypothetical protein
LDGLTPGSALMTRDAVLGLTPASTATSRSVGRAAGKAWTDSALRRTALLGYDGSSAAMIADRKIEPDYRQLAEWCCEPASASAVRRDRELVATTMSNASIRLSRTASA